LHLVATVNGRRTGSCLAMTTKLSIYLAQVDYLLSADDDELSAAARSSLVESAIEHYSHDLPDEVTTDVSGDAGKYYGVSVSLTSWSEGFSQIIAIEYPAPTVASDEAPTYLEPEDWDDDYWADGVRYLYLPNHAPAVADTMRIRYTAPYTATATAYTIPVAHFSAVCYLAAGLCAQAIANKYSRTNDSSIAADSVNHTTRATEWASRARAMIKLYHEQLNIQDDSGGQPAGQFVDWNTEPAGGRRRWLYH
jgi:hypothetical protein